MASLRSPLLIVIHRVTELAFLNTWQRRVDAALAHWLPAPSLVPTQLHQAMQYAVMGGGKRFRPILVYAAGTALQVPLQRMDPAACAVELIHAYSLTHDDLPAMDDDDLRRGQPTCHKAFNEATAILAGDALQSLAFQILSQSLEPLIPPAQQLEMITTLAIASGSRGMAGGQAIDVAAVGQTLNEAELENMHIHKTGALIRASIKLGALCAAPCERESLNALDHYAKCIGLAFQIQDDILDEIGQTQTLGKTQGSDRHKSKPTYPSIIGLTQSRQLAQELCDDARTHLAMFDGNADPLRQLAHYIIERTH
ncbi:MAG: (2E,6E)-farnesyl diphosphate synthase [Gammaproteobacteria bacterium]|nr:(2E,6E)-farnesyl diphosphate synthase [Gammaproteobacteria bacterium]